LFQIKSNQNCVGCQKNWEIPWFYHVIAFDLGRGHLGVVRNLFCFMKILTLNSFLLLSKVTIFAAFILHLTKQSRNYNLNRNHDKGRNKSLDIYVALLNYKIDSTTKVKRLFSLREDQTIENAEVFQETNEENKQGGIVQNTVSHASSLVNSETIINIEHLLLLFYLGISSRNISRSRWSWRWQ